MISYQIVMINMPGKVNECVTLNEDDSYTIFINDSLSPDSKREALLHAFRHINSDDFYIEGNVNEIEMRCRNEY